MDKPTTILSWEHQNILKVIEMMIREIGALQKSQTINEIFWAKIIDFIQNYADKFHHAKEEEILFKEFCKNETVLHCNPVEQMLYEHNLGRNFVKGLKDGLEKKDANQISVNAQEYAQLLQNHIFKENNILYPMIDEVLDKKVQKLILSQFKKAEAKKLTPAEKEKYLTIVKELENNN